MSLFIKPIPTIPTETARVALAAFAQGNLYLQMSQELGVIYEDASFSHLFPAQGQPAYAPWRLAMVTLMQYIEGLSDRQAAQAVRSRIDWKYVLRLELSDSGFDHSVLSEFRLRLLVGSLEDTFLTALLEKCRQMKLLKLSGSQRSDSTHVLASIRAMTRLECVGEALRYALNSLAELAPEWLQKQYQPHWLERYGRRMEDYHLPKSKEKRKEYALSIGQDGEALLEAVYQADTPPWLRQVPALQILRRVWLQQYWTEGAALSWREQEIGLPPSSLFISSPYDLQAHYAKKDTTSWVGYKVHFTETCDPEFPRLITNVATTTGPISDGDTITPIHQSLQGKHLLPSRHIVDTGYLDAELLVSCRQDFGVEMVGPTRLDYRWQAQAGKGFDAASFTLDWSKQQATCPRDKISLNWSVCLDARKQEVVKIKFSPKDCRLCPSHADCTKAKRRTITLRREDRHLALMQAREREKSVEFVKEYAQRAGIEGTISQAVRAFGARRAKYVGQAKTHLQHLLIASAINFTRISNWIEGKQPAQTRQSAFQKLFSPPSIC